MQISDECDPSWVTHLQAGLELVYRRPAGSVGSETLRRFFAMYFVAHDIMSRTASGARERRDGSYIWTEVEDIDEVEGSDVLGTAMLTTRRSIWSWAARAVSWP